MAEVSNRTLAILVVLTLAAVTVSTFLRVAQQDDYSITGFATTDTGYVNLTVDQTLAIAVDATNSTINFGSCVPRGGTSYYCASNDTAVCSGNNALGNCSDDTTSPQFIRLDNVGNVDANVTMTSECTAATFIGGTSPLFDWITTSCNGTGVSTWTPFTTSSQNVCTNVSYLGGQLRLYANVTIPFNAVGGTGGCDELNDVVFSATLSP